MLLALLFIPAMNLSGMMSSRMDERLSELGVRKTYGATNMRLIGQVLWENLLLTCIGGLLGLLISYLIVLTASDWILTLFDSYTDVEKLLSSHSRCFSIRRYSVRHSDFVCY